MKYGIAFTEEYPPNGITGWYSEGDRVVTWDDPYQALEQNENLGWTGYVCEYPSGIKFQGK